MPWPSAQEYNEAISEPSRCFENEQLASGEVCVDSKGLPRPISGGFANVYKIRNGDRSYAVKCFLRETSDHQERYTAIQKALLSCSLPYFTNFDYIPKGIKVRNVWHPVLKMDWEDGDTLDTYIFKNINNPANIALIAREFKQLVAKLQSASIAHGDLQHGNIIVQNNRLRLLDYDGSFVKALEGKKSSELGHPNYQHPRRVQNYFGLNIDNFSSWVIHTSLLCLGIDPTLWNKLAGGDECLLFRATDFGDPCASYTFAVLEESPSSEIKSAARMMRSLCDEMFERVPTLQQHVEQPRHLDPIKRASSVPAWVGNTPPPGDGAKVERQSLLASYRAYNEAVRWPQISFDDLELARGTCILEDTKIGRSGRVYHFRCKDRDVAVKCFSFEQEDRALRYAEIAKYLESDSVKQYVSKIQYLPEGIRVLDKRYPILKMDWFDGQTLSQMATGRIPVSDGTASYLADRLAEMARTFQFAGIAHGDLDFSNLMFVDTDLKLVDYDNFFVPSLSRMKSPDSGHAGFQHPKRTVQDFGSYVDNFSVWLVHYLITMLPINPRLFEVVEKCLQDEAQTANAKTALRALETNDRQPEVRQLGKLLRWLLSQQPATIPVFRAVSNFDSFVSGRGEAKPTSSNPFLKRRTRQ